MPKKHRVKRQKYVDHLRKLEKERDAYLEKRMRPKRSREVRNEEDVMAGARDAAESSHAATKKRRTEATAEEPVEAVVKKEQAPAPAVTAAASSASAVGLFLANPFTPSVSASIQATGQPSKGTTHKKSDEPTSAAAARKVKRKY